MGRALLHRDQHRLQPRHGAAGRHHWGRVGPGALSSLWLQKCVLLSKRGDLRRGRRSGWLWRRRWRRRRWLRRRRSGYPSAIHSVLLQNKMLPFVKKKNFPFFKKKKKKKKKK